ncbi:MAG: hypothetical protein ACR2H3_17270 [Acidimicrobiales bacterium]
MTIEKGKPWGEAAALPPDGVVVGSDAEARLVLEEARHAGLPFPVIGLTGGDLWRTLGGIPGKERLHTEMARTFPVDLGQVQIDGRLHLFIAHVVVRDALWRRTTVAMNAQWIGSWNIGHKAHPNDGKLDLYEANLRLGDLTKVRSRLSSGSFLPHPRITYRRAAAEVLDLGTRRPIRLDGQLVVYGRELVVRAQPDAVRVVV